MLTDEVPNFSLGNVSVSTSVRSELRAFRNQVLSRIGHAAFIDVRSPEEYRGELLAPPHLPQEQAQVPGHIPRGCERHVEQGCQRRRNFPFRRRAPDPLQGCRDHAGPRGHHLLPDWRSHTWFVLHELLGHPDVKNYDGSWTEYGSLVGEPVEKG
jgi:thiosulfate/3-mercaptopyruvate sulfurtransferase